MFKKLLLGLASLIIDRSGQARIAVWGVSAPARGEAVYSVRQNLWPLVLNRQPTAQVALWWRWGGTNSHVALDPRSALGQDPPGTCCTRRARRPRPRTWPRRWLAAARGSEWNWT